MRSKFPQIWDMFPPPATETPTPSAQTAKMRICSFLSALFIYSWDKKEMHVTRNTWQWTSNSEVVSSVGCSCDVFTVLIFFVFKLPINLMLLGKSLIGSRRLGLKFWPPSNNKTSPPPLSLVFGRDFVEHNIKASSSESVGPLSVSCSQTPTAVLCENSGFINPGLSVWGCCGATLCTLCGCCRGFCSTRHLSFTVKWCDHSEKMLELCLAFNPG